MRPQALLKEIYPGSPTAATGRPRGAVSQRLATCATRPRQREEAPDCSGPHGDGPSGDLFRRTLCHCGRRRVGALALCSLGFGGSCRLGSRRGRSLRFARGTGLGRLASLGVPSQASRVLVPVGLAHSTEPVLLARCSGLWSIAEKTGQTSSQEAGPTSVKPAEEAWDKRVGERARTLADDARISAFDRLGENSRALAILERRLGTKAK